MMASLLGTAQTAVTSHNLKHLLRFLHLRHLGDSLFTKRDFHLSRFYTAEEMKNKSHAERPGLADLTIFRSV